MKKVIYLGAIMAAMCVSGANAQTTGSGSGSGGNNSGAMQQMNGGNSSSKAADAKFMMMAATSDMNEISLSNIALAKSTSDEVKRMAQMMIDDHTKSSAELAPLAMSKGVTVSMQPDAKHQAMATKMQAMSGMDFDMMYIKAMVKDHEKAVKMFQKESTGGKDADARAFATKTLPVIQGHLTMAQSMMTGMKNGMKNGSMAGGKMSGM